MITLERQLFTWRYWDAIDVQVFQYEDCTVEKAFGPFGVGDKISNIVMDYGKSLMQVIGNEGTVLWEGSLKLFVVEHNH